VAEGRLIGQSLPQLMAQFKTPMLGRLADRFDRFPLLLKFLDVHEMLSVQVHPADDMADLLPKGETGKTEAWVVLEAEPNARIYAGLKPGATRDQLATLTAKTVDDLLSSFSPVVGQAVLIKAGTVHSLGDGAMVFEVQENSDVTFRLYDWDHVDAKTGKPRDMQMDQALACINFDQGRITPAEGQVLEATPLLKEQIIDTAHFQVTRSSGTAPFPVGGKDEPRILVCLAGGGRIAYEGSDYALRRGGVMLLPASVGPCRFTPNRDVIVLEIAVPDAA
jgi:mannose-6-phosphate isomerase